MQLFDTHCHVQSIGADSVDFTVKKWRDGGVIDASKVIDSAKKAGVDKVICVGTDLEDSERVVTFASRYENCWAAVGIHPHEAKDHVNSNKKLRQIRNLLDEEKIVAVGEIGLDYFYDHSPKKDQFRLLEWFLDQASQKNLPVIFHVREAHKDFWPILDNFQFAGQRLRGVMHSFSAGTAELEESLKRGLYIGLNGIMTFSKDEKQLAVAKAVPLDKLLLETDAPYLAPKPYRGQVCEPKHVLDVARFLSNLRNESLEQLAAVTYQNSKELFNIN
jgi:TatD DNase family protein